MIRKIALLGLAAGFLALGGCDWCCGDDAAATTDGAAIDAGAADDCGDACAECLDGCADDSMAAAGTSSGVAADAAPAASGEILSCPVSGSTGSGSCGMESDCDQEKQCEEKKSCCDDPCSEEKPQTPSVED